MRTVSPHVGANLLALSVVALAVFGIRTRQRWALWTALLVPDVSLAIVVPIHHLAVLLIGIAMAQRALKAGNG